MNDIYSPKYYGINTLLQQPVFELHADGSIGREVENLLRQQGLKINQGPGPDLPSLGIEVKTRKNSSGACITLGTIKPQDILKYQYSQTDLFAKLRDKILLYSIEDGVITDEEIIFFSDPTIQQKLNESYKFIKQVLQQESLLVNNQNFSSDGFTRECYNGVMKMRVQNAKFNALKKISRQSNHFHNMFEMAS